MGVLCLSMFCYPLLCVHSSFSIILKMKRNVTLKVWNIYITQRKTATSFFLPHQNLAKSHHLSSGAKDSKPLKYKNTDIREQNIYNYD